MLTRSLTVVRRCRKSIAAASLLGTAACGVASDGASQPVAESARSSFASASTASSAPAGAAGRAVAPRAVRRVVLTVKGMYCESCSRTVTVMLRRTPGVRSADVSVARGEAVVSFDPAQTTPAALVAVIERLGYRATIRTS